MGAVRSPLARTRPRAGQSAPIAYVDAALNARTFLPGWSPGVTNCRATIRAQTHVSKIVPDRFLVKSARDSPHSRVDDRPWRAKPKGASRSRSAARPDNKADRQTGFWYSAWPLRVRSTPLVWLLTATSLLLVDGCSLREAQTVSSGPNIVAEAYLKESRRKQLPKEKRIGFLLAAAHMCWNEFAEGQTGAWSRQIYNASTAELAVLLSSFPASGSLRR
jgi:hypothetical protein